MLLHHRRRYLWHGFVLGAGKTPEESVAVSFAYATASRFSNILSDIVLKRTHGRTVLLPAVVVITLEAN